MEFLVVIFVAFLALVAYAPKELMQILLVFAWIGGLATIIVPLLRLLWRLPWCSEVRCARAVRLVV